MWYLLSGCSPFPCAVDELLDAEGNCHAADPSDTATTGGDPTDTDVPIEDSTGSTDSADSTGEDSGGTDTATLPQDDGWPARFVAPYVDATAYPTVRIGEIPAENGIDRYTLGFIVAASASTCDASWGTYYSVETGPSAWDGGGEYFLYDQIATLRAGGGDVMVSFGGAANTPIEAACPDVATVVDQYRRVIETLDLTRIDFDIEGSWGAHDESITRRSEAIAALQAWAAGEGRALHVWYTLPVLPTGLTADGLAVVESAIDHGVDLAGVNVMTMDYGNGTAPNPEGQMGEYGIAAIEAVHAQLSPLWPSLTATEVWGRIGSTPMIGQNDVSGEFFDIEDAGQTREFAESVGLGMLGFWSTNRDHPCAEEVEWAQSTCNGSVDIPDWAFSAVFSGY